MQAKLSISAFTIIGVSTFLGYAAPALSAPLTLGYDATYNGSSVVTIGSGYVNSPGVPSSSTYGNTFTAATPLIPGTPSPGYGFYDDYLFSISGATVNSITTTIDLGSLSISNLQERLYNLSGNSPPVLGTPGVPVGGAIDAWTSPIGTSGTVDVLSNTTLSAGTYVLEIRGTAGTNGGSYAGTLNVVPVPLPAALPLMLAGLGLVVRVARRRTAS